MSSLEKQEGGDHYKKLGHYQPWEVLAKWLTPEELAGYAKGTAVAYLAREQSKGGRLDIQKAVHTLQIYLELTEVAPAPATLPILTELVWICEPCACRLSSTRLDPLCPGCDRPMRLYLGGGKQERK